MKRGFTLIELLVVIAIIAILAAILFPVFAQAKAAAKRTQDLSNQKQIVTALMLYAGDYDDHSVVAHHELEPDQSPSDLYLWFQPLQPYVKNREVFRDPALKSSPTLFPDFLSPATFEENRTDYLLNGFFSHGVSMTLFSRPAEQIIFFPRHAQVGFFDYHPWPSAPDNNWERGLLNGSGYVLGDVESDTQVLDPRNTGRHMGGINVAFADGHAKWYRFTRTLDPSKPANAVDNWGMHNIDNLPAIEHDHDH